MRHRLAEHLITRSTDHFEAGFEAHVEGDRHTANRQWYLAVALRRLSALVGYERPVRRNVRRTLDLA